MTDSLKHLQFSSLVELLRYRALKEPDKTAFIFLQDGEEEVSRLTYKELDRQARAISGYLQSLCTIGDRVLLLYPQGLEFVSAFFGCLYAGVVAVPVNLPRSNGRSVNRLESIVADAQAAILLTNERSLSNVQQQLTDAPNLASQVLATDNLALDLAEVWQEITVNSDTLAFLQYTSGSTGTPKGVMVSHGNLLQNSEYIKSAFELTPNSVSVTWLPSFHDMGLIDGVLQPLYTGFLSVMMPPASFVQQPIRWLKAISDYKATHCGGPNFGYDLCVSKIIPEQRANLDLSSWCSAYSGAEPVHRETLEKFAATFKSSGFQAKFFYPCYGMAEATLMISGGGVADEPVYCAVDAKALEKNRIVEVSEDTPKIRHLVGCGYAWLDTKIAIADPQSLTLCPPEQVGEIWASGSSIAKGYWNRPEQTKETFHAYLADTSEGPFLRTGDLGFLKDGELFITGRLKDVVIIRGRNHYPQDIELTVEQSYVGLRTGASAAFSVFSVDVDKEERLIILQEVERSLLRNLDVEQVTKAIRQAVTEHHDLQPYAVLLLKTGSILKTSSGKIQRRACQAAYLAGSLNVVGEWTQSTSSPVSLPQPTKEFWQRSHLLKQHKSEQAEAIESWLVSKLAQQLKVSANSIDIHEPFATYGLDSMAAVLISGELAQWLRRQLSPTLVYDYPNIEALARSLSEESSVSYQGDTEAETEAIAILGIGCRFPGAKNPEAFWQLLKNGEDAIVEVPTSRWDANAFYHSASVPKPTS